jgi:hypothetical protein
MGYPRTISFPRDIDLSSYFQLIYLVQVGQLKRFLHLKQAGRHCCGLKKFAMACQVDSLMVFVVCLTVSIT